MMNLPDRCDYCLRKIDDHLLKVSCTDVGGRGDCGPASTSATMFGLAGKLLQERNEAMVYIKQLEDTINPVRDWFDGDGENTDVLQMLTEAITQLPIDRKELLRLSAIVDAPKTEKAQVDWYSPEEVREWLVKK